jgi:hypothetical protein
LGQCLRHSNTNPVSRTCGSSRSKPGEAEAEADVLRLKPGEKPCDHPDCRKAATARAPKSRERLNDFYNFCQPHAAEYNKAWNFYAGMNEAQIRAAKENEAMTGGRPTWDMKASKNSREAATFAAKMGTANTPAKARGATATACSAVVANSAAPDRGPPRRQDRGRRPARPGPGARRDQGRDQGSPITPC